MTNENRIFDIVVESEMKLVLNWFEATLGYQRILLGDEFYIVIHDLDYFNEPEHPQSFMFHAIPRSIFEKYRMELISTSVFDFLTQRVDKSKKHYVGLIDVLPISKSRIQLVGSMYRVEFEDYLMKIGDKVATIFQCHTVYIKGRAAPKSDEQEQLQKTKRKGGPKGTSKEEREKYVKGWLREQDKISQEGYCHREGFGASTLRSWMRKMKDDGDFERLSNEVNQEERKKD